MRATRAEKWHLQRIVTLHGNNAGVAGLFEVGHWGHSVPPEGQTNIKGLAGWRRYGDVKRSTVGIGARGPTVRPPVGSTNKSGGVPGGEAP